MSLLAREDVSFREVADAIKTDAALAAEVLRLANSALAGARYRVSSILEGLAMVGTQRLASLLTTLSLSKMVQRCGSTKTIRGSWRHSLACALAAREYAASFGCEPDEAYLSGLFHDVGRLALLMLQPELYEKLIEQDGDLRKLEKEHFGLDHCEAGVLLIEQWKLPRMFAHVAGSHHDPALDADKLILVVHAACATANELGFSVRPTTDVPDISEKLGFSIAETINLLEQEYGI